MERATREGKDMGHTLSVVEKAGNMTIAEEDVLRQQLVEMEEAEEKEQTIDRAIEDKIQVSTNVQRCRFLPRGAWFLHHPGLGSSKEV